MIRKHFFVTISIFGFLVLSQIVAAQQREVNPFDIGAKPAAIAPSTGGATSQTAAPENQNPFDINKKDTPERQNDVIEVLTSPNAGNATISSDDSVNPFDIKAQTVQTPQANVAEQPLTPGALPSVATITKAADPAASKNFLFILMFSMLLILTVLVTLSRNLIRKIYNAMFNETSLKALHRDKGPINALMYNLLYAMFVINLGVFAFLCVRQYFLIGGSQWLTLLSCTTAIGVVVVAKHSILNAMMVVFPIYKEINFYNFIIIIFGIMMGCILAPMNLILAYASPETAKQVAIAIAAILFLFFLLRYLRSMLVTTKFVATNIVHYILYVMALEVAPVIVMVKLFLLKFSQSI